MLLDQILLHVPCPIFWKNLDGAFLGCNQLFLEVGNFHDYSQLIGKKDDELPWKEYKDEYYKDDQYVITTGKTITRVEHIPLHGRTIISETTKAPLIQDGNIIGVLGISLDITDRKEKERLEVESKSHKAVVKAQEKFRQLVGQMVHDIRQPLASLQMTVSSTKEIPEEKRIVLRDSAIAITDITSQLLRQYEPENKTVDEVTERQIVLISTILADIVGDRRRKYKDLPITFQYEITQLNAFVFIKVNISDLRRAISNIINNAVEALPKAGGIIDIRLKANDEWVSISVLDDGVGVPKELLDKIKEKKAVTQGKNGGHGIGLVQVRDMIEHNYGEFDIMSSTGNKSRGTTISLRFPKVMDPDWIAEEVNLMKNDIVIILDDDNNIHGGWDSRFGHIIEKVPTITIKHFFDGQETINFINSLSKEEKEQVCFLSDYELIGQELNGLQVIIKAKIKRSILVTSHYANIELRKTALQNKVRVLPKDLVHLVPINIIQARVKGELVNVHMVFIDDEKIFTKTLVSRYYSHLITNQYSNPFEFLDEVDKYPKDTRFILDNYYYMPDGGTYNIDGVTLAQKLHDKGFTKLIMLSGEEFSVPDYLKLVIKIDQENISKLDKI